MILQLLVGLAVSVGLIPTIPPAHQRSIDKRRRERRRQRERMRKRQF